MANQDNQIWSCIPEEGREEKLNQIWSFIPEEGREEQLN